MKQITGAKMYIPKTTEEYDALKEKSDDDLSKLQLGPWHKWKDISEQTKHRSNLRNMNDDDRLWLFPGSWYKYIPDGYYIVDIYWMEQPFNPRFTTNETYCDLLCYGFVKKAKDDSTK